MTIKNLAPMIAIAAALATAAPAIAASTPSAGAATYAQPASVPYDSMAGAIRTSPAPTQTAKLGAKCEKLFGSTWICQVTYSWGTSEYLCDTELKLCIKQ